jgi:DNA repair protein SbcD/Mre11
MAGESFRFIHASDFHLEHPPGDLDLLPTHLRESLATAPFKAAAAVFEAAMVENIDFLVLAGDLLHPATAGPRGISLLLNHFEQLHQQKTPVFWAAGSVDDAARWPEAVPLPPNVTLFPRNRTLSIPVQRAGRTICQVIGRSSEGRTELHVPSFRVDSTDEFTVAVGWGTADADSLIEGRFDYWALGGEHQRVEITGGATAGAVYCGTPQGRSLQETGPHGYTLVDIDSERNARIHPVDCDLFRYCDVELDAAEIAASGNIRGVLAGRIARLLHDNGSRNLIIGWDIVVSADTMHAIGDPNELLQWLRREYGHGTPSAWTAKLTVRPPKNYPKNWCDEDTILGDFLRAAARHGKAGGRELNLAPFTEEQTGLSRSVSALLTDVPANSRGELLDEATLIGVEYLRGTVPSYAGQGEKS